MPRPEVRPGTIVVYTDIACAWSTVAIVRLLRARDELGLTDRVHLDHRCFLLEDVNAFLIPKKFLDSGIPVVGALEPGLGWKNWQGDPADWPVTTALIELRWVGEQGAGFPVVEHDDQGVFAGLVRRAADTAA